MEGLELVVDSGRAASAGRFFQLGYDLLGLLDELSDMPVEWVIDDLRLGSAVARVAPPAGSQQGGLLRLLVDSLDAVQRGADLSTGWTPDAVRAAHRFVAHSQDGQDDAWEPPTLVLVPDDVTATRPTVRLTQELSVRLADLQPFERQMPGAVRGTLVGLNVSRGNRASLRLPNKRVVRVSFDSSLREELKLALYRDLELQGLVRQDGDGQLFHITADALQVLEEPTVRWAELLGIDPDYTGALTATQWLEEQRGDA